MKWLCVIVVSGVLTAWAALPAVAESVEPASQVTRSRGVSDGLLVADSSLVSPSTGAETSSPNSMYNPSFALDGTAVAGFSGGTNRDGERILAMTRAGEWWNHRLATFPGDIIDQAWSPDGRLVAVTWTDPDREAYRLSVVRVDKSRPPRLLLRTSNARISYLDWRVDTGELAVLIDRQLVYVSRDGTSARNVDGACPFTPPRAPTCPATPTFSNFDLSPDGASAVVEVDPGQTLATITDDGSGTVSPLTDDEGGPVLGQAPLWSPDGTTIAFWSNDPQAPGITVMPAAGGDGRFVREYGVSEPDDWQPCPDDVCPRFASKYAPDLSLNVRIDGTTVTGHGVLQGWGLGGQPLTLLLERWHDGRYELVDRGTVTTGERGEYHGVFDGPGRGKCRIVARYAGEEFFYLPARAHRDFAC